MKKDNDERDLREKAIFDANINRAAEGLRVVEDWARFYLMDTRLTESLREIRHRIWERVKGSYPEIIKARSTGKDILSQTVEGERKKAADIPKASLNRVKEALRVLEEFGKLLSREAGSEFKQMRFKLYDLELKFYEKDNKKDS